MTLCIRTHYTFNTTGFSLEVLFFDLLFLDIIRAQLLLWKYKKVLFKILE